MSVSQIDNVKKYYDSTVVDYKIFWTGSKDLAMHFGYYDDKTKSHKDSLIRMNEVLAKLANVSDSDRVMDAGCGYGGSTIWLAKNIGCEVMGVTIIPYQLKIAKRFAEKYGLSSKVSFLKKDYTHTSFPNNSFTVIWGLESIVHAESKKDFINEAYRLLKPRGRVLISEYMLQKERLVSDKENKIIDSWLKGWAMPSLLTAGEYIYILTGAGFKNIKVNDLTDNVRPSLSRLEKFSNFVFPFASLLHKLRILSTEHFGNVEASVTQSRALRMGLWKYMVITGEKS